MKGVEIVIGTDSINRNQCSLNDLILDFQEPFLMNQLAVSNLGEKETEDQICEQVKSNVMLD